ncbi:unnamed protein product [Eruca vesicaria subsp. sativa]|uniref:Uncharacterized protein n=1 Tax=Eruca vesicaria subsp. sativa TaxID=29727 RepID=A0ABC8LXY5_ERUVS|nr:unnamed protein product [Eruca vesicaria subsp. sativa]
MYHLDLCINLENQATQVIAPLGAARGLGYGVHTSHNGQKGEHGTWFEFLKFYDPRNAYLFHPDSRSDPTLIQFLTSINKKDDSRKLALLLNPSRPLVCDYSYEYPNETAEQRLVRKTLTHDEYPLDFLIRYNPKDWVKIKS